MEAWLSFRGQSHVAEASLGFHYVVKDGSDLLVPLPQAPQGCLQVCATMPGLCGDGDGSESSMSAKQALSSGEFNYRTTRALGG